MNNKELPAETAAEKTTEDQVLTSSHTIGKPHVACRFGLSHHWGLSFITWYSNKRNLSLEATLRMAAKWLNFIYRDSPFSIGQRMLFPNRWKLFWLRFWNSPISLLVPVIVAVLLSWLIIYLSINYIMK